MLSQSSGTRPERPLRYDLGRLLSRKLAVGDRFELGRQHRLQLRRSFTQPFSAVGTERTLPLATTRFPPGFNAARMRAKFSPRVGVRARIASCPVDRRYDTAAVAPDQLMRQTADAAAVIEHARVRRDKATARRSGRRDRVSWF